MEKSDVIEALINLTFVFYGILFGKEKVERRKSDLSFGFRLRVAYIVT